MGAGAILWSLKNQHIVVLSSTEAEYIAQMHMAKEALWLHSFLQELCSAPDDPLILNCDNQGAIALTKDNKFHMHTKHIDVHYHLKQLRMEKSQSDTFQLETMFPTFLPSHSQKLNSRNLLSYSGCA